MNNNICAIDLFSGGGGLTVGLKKAGFSVVSAVENDTDACKVFHRNHPDVHLFEEDIINITGKDILKTNNNNPIDFITGCPPCQSFSSLSYKNKKDDARNQLIFEMYRLVKELSPKMVMLENVSGLANGYKGKQIFQDFVKKIKKGGYSVYYKVFQVADFGVPQYRKRLVMFATKKGNFTLPKSTHSNNHVPVSNVLGGMTENPVLYSNAKKNNTLYKVNWHVIRDMKEITKQRLKYATAGKSWKTIPVELRPNCHKKDDAGFSNVYGRMDAGKPSPTITRGCTTFSMGRFGHPTKLRTLSVREAALIQTFPKDYEFPVEKIESVCKIIGNALPCLFAEKLARHCIKYLKK